MFQRKPTEAANYSKGRKMHTVERNKHRFLIRRITKLKYCKTFEFITHNMMFTRFKFICKEVKTTVSTLNTSPFCLLSTYLSLVLLTSKIAILNYFEATVQRFIAVKPRHDVELCMRLQQRRNSDI